MKLSKPSIVAIKAVERGEATPQQQQAAIACIVKQISDRDSMSFKTGPDGDRETAFAEGKRYVGNKIVDIVTTPLEKLFPKT